MGAEKRKAAYAMSRRKRNILFAVCLVAVAGLCLFDHTYVRYQDRYIQGSGQEKTAVGDEQKYHGRTFRVVKVVDGDTIDIDVADGEYEHTRIRLWGVDTPETKNPRTGVMYFGPEATEFTTKLTLDKDVTVYLDEGNRTRGKYGRLLAYVQLEDDRYLNEVLLSEGFAYFDLRFRHSFYNKYRQLESAARSQKKGLWEQVSQEQLPGWLQKRKPALIKN